MVLNSRSFLFSGVVLAGLMAGAGGFLFFANVPEPGASREEVFAALPRDNRMKSVDIDRIIAERQALAPRPSNAARAQVAAALDSPASPLPDMADAERRLASADTLAETPADAGRDDGRVAPAPAVTTTAGIVESEPLQPLPEKPAKTKARETQPAGSAGDPGEALYNAGRYPEAMANWRSRAEAGDSWAAYRLGVEYLIGRPEVVSRDPAEAVKWLRLAANRNEGLAQYAFAGQLEAGEGVAQDRIESLKFYILAANQGVRGDIAKDAADEKLPSDTSLADPVARLRAELTADQAREAETRAAAFQPVAE